MKTVRVRYEEGPGVSCVVPVMVDWFPPLTDDQIVANVLAREEGRSEPFPDRNLFEVEMLRPVKVVSMRE